MWFRYARVRIPIPAPLSEKVELFDLIIEIDFDRVDFFVVRRNCLKVIEEKIEMNNELRKKIVNMASFNGAKACINNGSIRYVPKTNIAYIEPFRVEMTNKSKKIFFVFGDKNIRFISESNLRNPFKINGFDTKLNYK